MAGSTKTIRLLTSLALLGVVLAVTPLATSGAAHAQTDDSDGEGDGTSDGDEINDGTDPLDPTAPTEEPTEELTAASTAATSSTGNTPAFHIKEWSTSPSNLQRDMEFDLWLKIQNVGTSKAEDVLVTIGTSNYFVNVGNDARLSSLSDGSSKSVTLRVGIAPDLESGYYSIPVEISGYDTKGGSRVTETRSVGVYVEGLSPDAGSSAFSIDNWSLQPEGLYAGAQFDLGITLTNIGTADAEETLVTIGSSSNFVNLGPSPNLGYIGSGESKTATLRVGVSDNVGSGYYSIPVEISFNNNTGEGSARLSDSGSVGVYVTGGGTSSEVSEFLLERYAVVPETITPGTSFQLQLVLVNRGIGSARQFFVRLGQSSVLAPVGGSNVQYLEQVEAGSSVTLTYDLVVDGSAEAGLASIDVNLEYEDVYGNQQQQTETISLAVVERPYFQIGLFDEVPATVQVGDVFDVPVEVINIGRDLVNVSTIEVVSESMRITEGTLYIGPLDGGSSGSLVASAEALQVGTAIVEVRIHYLDSFQQPQTVTRTLMRVEVESPPPVPLDEAAPAVQAKSGFFQQFWQAILGLLGLRTEPADEAAVSP